jgi:hypothetical protein
MIVGLMMKRLLAFLAISACATTMANAEEWQLAGHRVAVDAVDDGYRLSVDGAELLQDWLILVEGKATLPGGAVLYGVAGPGGNACNAAPFALWLPQDGPPRLDAQIETCSFLVPEVTGEGLRWTSERVVGRMTESWLWSPAAGIVAGPTMPFAPDAGRAWEDLASLADQHPAEALKLEPVYNLVAAALGEDFQPFAERIAGLGSGGMVGPDFYGEACLKEVCDTDFAGIWLDQSRQEVFGFWAVGGAAGLGHFPQNLSLWPEGARQKLAEHGGP